MGSGMSDGEVVDPKGHRATQRLDSAERIGSVGRDAQMSSLFML